MSNADRIEQELMADPVDMPYSRIRTLLRARAWELVDGKGSHVRAYSPAGRMIVLSPHRDTIKRYQLRMIREELVRTRE